MKDVIIIKPYAWSSGKSEGTWTEQDNNFGKHFCWRCRKMIRVGQRVITEDSPAPFKRETRTIYRHKEC